jgi:hypothetical protein
VAAAFLAGAGRPCRIVDASFDRSLDLEVVAPVTDFLTTVSDTVWDSALQELQGWIESHRTTLIFTPSRRMAERLARNLNERLPEGQVAAHHGSLSRRARLEAEDRLAGRSGRWSTSSLELESTGRHRSHRPAPVLPTSPPRCIARGAGRPVAHSRAASCHQGRRARRGGGGDPRHPRAGAGPLTLLGALDVWRSRSWPVAVAGVEDLHLVSRATPYASSSARPSWRWCGRWPSRFRPR